MPEWIIGFVGVIVGTILGWIGSLKVAKRQEFYRACSKFREQFIEEIVFLEKPIDPHSLSPTVDTLEKAKIKHESAITRFIPYLKKSNRIAIKIAYETYCNPYDTEINSFILYDGHQNGDFELSKEEGRKRALDNLNTILDCARFN